MIRLHTILCPIDFSECSRFAFEQACEYADQFGAALHILNVHPANVFGDGSDSPDSAIMDHREHADSQMDQFLGDTTGHCFPVVRTSVAGVPSKAICEHAGRINADLVVMGTHGDEANRKRLIGSVAEHVVRMSPCDVLTVHERRSRSTTCGSEASAGQSLPESAAPGSVR